MLFQYCQSRWLCGEMNLNSKQVAVGDTTTPIIHPELKLDEQTDGSPSRNARNPGIVVNNIFENGLANRSDMLDMDKRHTLRHIGRYSRQSSRRMRSKRMQRVPRDTSSLYPCYVAEIQEEEEVRDPASLTLAAWGLRAHFPLAQH